MRRIPAEWVTAQGAGSVSAMDHVDLWRAFMRGEDGVNTKYCEYLRGRGRTENEINELLLGRRAQMAGPQSDEPCPVRLTSLGRFELIDGHHRATRAVAEGVPVLVDVKSISPLWEMLVEKLRSIYSDNKLYQPIEHPWFDNWKVSRPNGRLRDAVRAMSNVKPGNLLEVGSCSGGFCREFARAGWRCFGVDSNARIVAIAEYLDLVFGTNVSYCRCDISTELFESIFMGGDGWGLIICLSVLHVHHTMGRTDFVAYNLRRMMDRADNLITDGDAPGRILEGHTAWDRERYMEWLGIQATPTHDVVVIGEHQGRTMYLCRRK